MLEEINKEIDGDAEADFRAIYFDLDTEILISRIVNRRSCPKCGEIYNLKFKPTKVEGICDKCGTELTQRKDDNEETAKLVLIHISKKLLHCLIITKIKTY